MREIKDLQELTGQESGAILFQSGEIWIGNWVGIQGIPREFATGTVGLGEDLSTAYPVEPDQGVIDEMIKYDVEHGGDGSDYGYKAWSISLMPEIVMVVINLGWA